MTKPWGPPTTPVSPRPSAGLIFAVVIFLNLFVNGIIAVMLEHSHRQQLQISQIDSEITGRVLEEGISRFIDKVDLTLLSVMDEVTRENQSGGLDSLRLSAVLARHSQRLPEALGLRVTDRSGHLLAASGPVKNKDGTIADSEPFRHWIESSDSGLFLSNPIAGEISGQPIIVIARKLVDSDGGFAGQVNISIALERLNQMLNAAQLGAVGSVTLSNKDGYVIARSPNPGGVAALLSRSQFLPTVYRLILSGHPADFFRAESTVDRISRSYAFRRVAGRDWYLIVGVADLDTLASWWRQVINMAALSALFAVMTTVGGVVWLRGTRLRYATNADLAASESDKKEQYQRLFADSPDAYLIMELDGGCVSDCNHAAEFLLRGSREQILGKTPDQLSPSVQPDGRSSRDAAAEKIVEVLRDGSHRFEWVHRRLDGDDFWAEVTIALSTYQGRQVLFVATAVRFNFLALAHGVDSTRIQAFGDVLDTKSEQHRAAPE